MNTAEKINKVLEDMGVSYVVEENYTLVCRDSMVKNAGSADENEAYDLVLKIINEEISPAAFAYW